MWLWYSAHSFCCFITIEIKQFLIWYSNSEMQQVLKSIGHLDDKNLSTWEAIY